MQRTDTKRKPQCPRCGYDLRGVMDMWKESCPLAGKCSECGLDFEWAIVTQPEKYEPHWCVEFSPGWRSSPKSGFKTFCRSFVPWLFWSRLKMSYPIRWKRLLLYFLALLLPYVFAYVLVQGTAAVIIRYRTQMWLDSYVSILPQQIQGLQSWINNPPTGYLEGFSPEEKKEIHKQRIANAKQALAGLQKMQNTPPTISLSYTEAVLEAVFFPRARTSSGKVGSGLLIPYTAPINLHEEVFLPPAYMNSLPGMTFNRVLWSRLRNLFKTTGTGFGTGLAAFILFPFTLLLLPASRRKAKVRWRHIIRVSVYNSFIPSTIFILLVWLCLISIVFPAFINTASDIGYTICIVGLWLGLIVWWSVAIKRYLKMPHGLAVSVLLCFMIGLVFTVIAAIADGVYSDWF